MRKSTRRKLLTAVVLASLVLMPAKACATDYSGGMTQLLQSIQAAGATNTFTATTTPINATQGLGSQTGTTFIYTETAIL